LWRSESIKRAHETRESETRDFVSFVGFVG
jgi:hypothetical protein